MSLSFPFFFFYSLIFVDRDSSRLVGACGPDVPNSQFYATAQLAQVSSCALLKCLLSGVLSSCGNDHDLIIRLFFLWTIRVYLKLYFILNNLEYDTYSVLIAWYHSGQRWWGSGGGFFPR